MQSLSINQFLDAIQILQDVKKKKKIVDDKTKTLLYSYFQSLPRFKKNGTYL